jgi:hypothetical protein
MGGTAASAVGGGANATSAYTQAGATRASGDRGELVIRMRGWPGSRLVCVWAGRRDERVPTHAQGAAAVMGALAACWAGTALRDCGYAVRVRGYACRMLAFVCAQDTSRVGGEAPRPV